MTVVACVGLAVRDLIFKVDALPSGQGKTHAMDRAEAGGGPAANAAVAIASLGGEPRFIGVLGADDLGDSIAAELEDLGVDVTRVRRLEGHRSPISSVTVDDQGERAIVNHTDLEMFSTAAEPGHEDLKGATAVLVDVRWQVGALAALRWARDNGVPGVVDFDIGAENGHHLLELASHVIFSADALARLTGSDDPERGLENVREVTDAWLAVTIGERGTVWLDGSLARTEPAHPVDVVDTTGAGDVYHGIFALELAGGSPELEAIRSASAAAALSCSRVGRGGVPTRDELTRFRKETR